jgi:hypothetical protein
MGKALHMNKQVYPWATRQKENVFALSVEGKEHKNEQ